MNETHVTITGNLTADPLQRMTRTGESFATMRVASTERRRRQDGSYENGSTSYYSVVCYGVLGRNVLGSLRKGMPVVVNGRQRITEWTSGERRGLAVDVQAYSAGPDLARCHAEVRRGPAPLRGNDRLDEAEIQEALAELDGRFVPNADGDLVDSTTGEVVGPEAVAQARASAGTEARDDARGGRPDADPAAQDAEPDGRRAEDRAPESSQPA